MKKGLMLCLLPLVAGFFIGCNKNDDAPLPPVSLARLAGPSLAVSGSEGKAVTVLSNEEAVSMAFTLDYRPQKAEGDDEADVLSAADLSGGVGDSGRGTIVGGGLRKFADYKTVYFDPAREKNQIEAIKAAQATAGAEQLQDEDTGPLTVIDWGPRGNYSAAVQNPSIYVIFSQPMTTLAGLGEQSSVSPIVSINPPIKGSFRWNGTSFLSFECEEPCQSQQTYTITVANNAASINGTVISGDRVFSFQTETLNIKNVSPGEEYRKTTGARFDNGNVPPEAARVIGLEFNYPVEADHIKQYLEIKEGLGRTVQQWNFTLTQENTHKVIATLDGPVDFMMRIDVTLKQGARSRGGTRGTERDQTVNFYTPTMFMLSNHNRPSGYGKYRNLVQLDFMYDVDESTVLGAISTVPAMPIGPENIEILGKRVIVYNLPVAYDERFELRIATTLKDTYGRNLYIYGRDSVNVTVPAEPLPEGSANFLGYGQVMLESQFSPRFLFEYKNLAPDGMSNSSGTSTSMYTLSSLKNPWANIRANDLGTSVLLKPGEINARYFEEIDLSPHLNAQGKGFVAFRANLYLLTPNRHFGVTSGLTTRQRTNELNIQVTDLGLTVRYGFNKAVVMVTSLSTGKPVERAKVQLFSISDVQSSHIDLTTGENGGFASALTDKNGLAILTMEPLVLRNSTNIDRWPNFSAPFVMAEKDSDRAIFNPSSHSSWRFGIGAELPQKAEEITALTFMFSDRGLYKPGELLTFRGVDRSKVLGMYTIYQGEYSISLEEDRHNGQVILSQHRATTESGSFHGAILVPDDLDPGSYRLVYRRKVSMNRADDIIANIPITVAFFERLKFQASLSAPAVAMISGDDINLNLQASYLSGGSLSGASWESSWYEEMSVFDPKRAETKGYVFGPRRVWDSKRYIASERGVLSGQGAATITQKTGGGKVSGAAYRYQAEARVTDISNQMVSASRSVQVHPARFYIGLRRGGGSGFARAGQEMTFDYMTVNTGGEKTSGNSLFLQSGDNAAQISVELVREEWRRVQQRGVNGYIYDEYSQEMVTDNAQKITISNTGAGTIKVKPSVAGFYTLRASSQDREGRTVLTELNFYATGSGGGYWNMSNPNELRLTPDQEVYEPGDTAKVLLQSPLPEGHYLITVEREGIFTEEVRHFTEPVSVLDIPVARNFVPVVYVSVSSYSVRSGPPTHEYGESDLDKPKGYFGVTKLKVNPRARAFSIKVESNKKTYRPGEEVTMTLTATKDGRPLPGAELCLMAVDRGVLDLINYHVPDPISYFYAEHRFPLSVAGGDSRAWLMDPVTYGVKNLAGGDGDEESKIEERRDFNPTAVFEPMLITDANGKVTCTFKLPDNLTTYRVTAFGVRGDLFALKESEIAAQNRINVREVVPRRLRERDTAEAGVLVTNLDASSHTITVKLDIGEPLSNDAGGGLRKIPGQAFVDGTAERRVTVRSGENAVVYFDVAAVKEGNITLNFTINSNILNERLIREMIIEHPYVMETVSTTGTVNSDTGREGIVIPSFADNGVGSLSLILDATRLGLLDSAVTYLFRYPYGCMEQRSAAIMPLVIFGDYLDSLSLRNEVANPRAVVEDELKSWAKVQLTSGGFPYWPSGTRGDFYVSLRIAHIIAIARSKEIAIPASLNVTALGDYLNREYQEIQRWQSSNSSYYYQSYLQSYMLYVRALLGMSVDASRLGEIVNRENVDPSALAFVGMAYRALGRNTEAANTAQRLRNLIRMAGRGADITDPLDKHRNNFYGGTVEQLALALQFFVDQYPGDEINGRLLYSLLENQRAGGGYWQSTAVTVRVLSAVDALIQAENLVNLDVNGAVSIAGTELLSGAFKGLGAKPVAGTFNFTDPVLASLARDRQQSLDFTRRGEGNIYYTASLRYAIPSELQSFRDEGLGVFYSIYNVDTGQEVDGSALENGKTYRGRVRVSSGRDRSYVALRVPVPSGAEILDSTFVTTSSYGDLGGASGNDRSDSRSNRSWISHQIILDNEIHYFWDTFNKGEATVNFLFRAVRRGVYPTPPAQAECMYEAEIFGRSSGLIYTIE